MKQPIFIAEIKQKSPYGFESRYSRSYLIDTALANGDWISIHTDPRFGGGFDDIYQIRKETKKPILAKGYHAHDDDIEKAFDLGADYVLVVDRVPLSRYKTWYNQILFEFSNLDSLLRVKSVWDEDNIFKIVYNGRNLRTGLGKKSIMDYHEYRKASNWLCGASLLKHPRDVQAYYPDCDAFIVGENLIEFCREKNHLKMVDEEKSPAKVVVDDSNTEKS